MLVHPVVERLGVHHKNAISTQGVVFQRRHTAVLDRLPNRGREPNDGVGLGLPQSVSALDVDQQVEIYRQ